MSDVLTFVEGRAGRIRLNRPKAIHALNTGMCAAMLDALDVWEADPKVEIVLIDHAEGRGFCAGGDIRMIAESGAGDGSAAREFFHTEYRLNHRLFTYSKPTVAFMDGITMGGGVGLSLPADYRIATDNTRFAMPETGIGLFPDVGGGWYLSMLRWRVGQYLALTGYRADGLECLNLGLATHGIATDTLDLVKSMLATYPRDIADYLGDTNGGVSGKGRLMHHVEDVERLFASDRLEDIYAALEADSSAFAAETLATLHTKSPQTMKVSLRLLAEGARMESFADEMRQEYAVATRVCRRHDFLEGVRAVIVDKDNAPRWNPSTPEGVSDHDLAAIFAPLPESEAWTPA